MGHRGGGSSDHLHCSVSLPWALQAHMTSLCSDCALWLLHVSTHRLYDLCPYPEPSTVSGICTWMSPWTLLRDPPLEMQCNCAACPPMKNPHLLKWPLGTCCLANNCLRVRNPLMENSVHWGVTKGCGQGLWHLIHKGGCARGNDNAWTPGETVKPWNRAWISKCFGVGEGRFQKQEHRSLMVSAESTRP